MRLRRSRLVPVLAGVVVVFVAVQLGNWQVRRADEKIGIQDRMSELADVDPVRISAGAPDPEEWSPVRVEGAWQPDAVMYYDNRVHEGRPGYHVLMPLEIGPGDWVLVNRGWVPAGRDRSVLPEVPPPGADVEISGVAVVPEAEPFSLTSDPREGLRWQYVDLDVYREWSELPVRDWVLQQRSDSGDGLVREWITPDVGVERHRGYALQWYSLAALALALTGFFVFRSFRKNDAE